MIAWDSTLRPGLGSINRAVGSLKSLIGFAAVTRSWDSAGDRLALHVAAELANLQHRELLAATVRALAAAVARQRARGRSPAEDLLGALVIEEGEAEGLLSALVADLAAEPTDDPLRIPAFDVRGPIGHAVAAFGLDRYGLLTLGVALGVEVDGRLARLVAYLNDHPGHACPTLALLWDLAGVPLGPARLALLETAAFRDGLFELGGDGPLSTREVRVAESLVRRLVGGATLRTEIEVTPAHETVLADLELPPDVADRAGVWLRTSGVRLPLLVVGPPGSGRRTLVAGLFGALGLATVSPSSIGPPDLALLRREARWNGAGVVVTARDSASAVVWDALRDLPAVAVVADPTVADVVRSAAPVEPFTVRLRLPDLEGRARLWSRSASGPRLAVGQADALAAQFPFGPGKILRAAGRAAVEGDWTPATLGRICREVGASSLGSLARRLEPRYRRDDLVLTDTLDRELALALSWVRHRQQVFGAWGLGARLPNGWGLTVLLSGPPGTGKTMAAQVLGRELDADVYRVDLSQVVSKFIGETEKHLGALLDEASAAGIVLLFDEADALFGRRSEVRDARDRYANLEVGFLLQRIEEHEGVVLLSTNRSGDMDEAFLRRFQFVLPFSLPDAPLRVRIWRGLLPWGACGDDIDVDWLAERFQVSGGDIRNAVLAAAFLAVGEGERIHQRHLLQAVRREVLKSGRVLRAAEREDPNGAVDLRGRR